MPTRTHALRSAKKPTKFRARTKAKTDIAPDHFIPLSPLEQVFELVNADADPDIQNAYEATTGTGNSVEGLVSSNFPESAALSDGIANALQRHLGDTVAQVAIRKQRIGVTPGSAAVLDVRDFRKTAMTRGVDTISGVHCYPIPCPSDPAGFEIATDMVGIFFGPNARQAVQRGPRARRSRTFSRTGMATVTWVDPTDEVPLRDALRKFVEPCLTIGLAGEGDIGRPLPADWADGAALRAFVMLQMWAMLPLRKRLVAAGAGRAILAGEIAQAEHRLVVASKGRVSPIHRDGVVHFLFGEMQRLGITGFTVPLVQLH